MKWLILFLITTNSLLAENIKVIVKGMVCEFCVKTLEKELIKEESIKDVEINLTSSTINITTYDNKILTDQMIEKIIINNGYNIESISR